MLVSPPHEGWRPLPQEILDQPIITMTYHPLETFTVPTKKYTK